MKTDNTIFPDITAQDLCDYKNWTGLTLRELVEAGRITNIEAVLEFLRIPLDDTIEKTITRIVNSPGKEKPHLDYHTEAYPLCVWGQTIRHEVLMLLGVHK